MRGVYRFLAGLIALEVIVQAAVMAFGVAGLILWVDEGNTFDKALLESDDADFGGLEGIIIHAINGMMVIPLLALIFFIVSFFAKVPKGVLWAGLVLLFTVLQVVLGLLGHSYAIAGGIHGANALLLFGLAVMAFMKSKAAPVAATTAPGHAEQPTRV
jgi:polyferredoxin